jgi:hypothetical protein
VNPRSGTASSLAKGAVARAESATTVDGLLAYAIPLPTGPTAEEVAFYKGQEAIIVTTHGKAGASVALAQLIAQHL